MLDCRPGGPAHDPGSYNAVAAEGVEQASVLMLYASGGGAGAGGPGTACDLLLCMVHATDSAVCVLLLQVIVSFLDWLCSQLRRPTHQSQSVPTSVSALACLLKDTSVRGLFHRCGGVALLAPLIRAGSTTRGAVQLTYEVGLCLWQLSYNPDACGAMVSSGMFPPICEHQHARGFVSTVARLL